MCEGYAGALESAHLQTRPAGAACIFAVSPGLPESQSHQCTKEKLCAPLRSCTARGLGGWRGVLLEPCEDATAGRSSTIVISPEERRSHNSFRGGLSQATWLQSSWPCTPTGLHRTELVPAHSSERGRPGKLRPRSELPLQDRSLFHSSSPPTPPSGQHLPHTPWSSSRLRVCLPLPITQ